VIDIGLGAVVGGLFWGSVTAGCIAGYRSLRSRR
jgi:hypothetical protein